MMRGKTMPRGVRTLLFGLFLVLVATFPAHLESVSCVVAPPDIVSWWRAEDLNDVVGTNHGMLAGNSWVAPGHVNQAFSFDGIGDSIEFGDVLNEVTVPFSVEGWVRVSAEQSGGIISSDDGNGNYFGFWLAIDGTQKLEVSYGDGGSACLPHRNLSLSEAINR